MRGTVRKPLPAGLPVTNVATEKSLLRRLESDISDSDYLATLSELADFYHSIHRNDLAAGIFQIMMEATDDTEVQAFCHLRLGGLEELKCQYDAALQYYLKGLAFKPTNKFTAYYLHNNTGYCLNVQGRYTDGERLCRKAIEIDSGRANAFKNLGLSFAGQNELVGAAWAYVEATRANARDSRAFHLLEKLIADHPEVSSQFPGILQELEACRKAVETAADPDARQFIPKDFVN